MLLLKLTIVQEPVLDYVYPNALALLHLVPVVAVHQTVREVAQGVVLIIVLVDVVVLAAVVVTLVLVIVLTNAELGVRVIALTVV